MKLSILIPTINGRENQFEALCAHLRKQIGDLRVEIVSLKDNKEITTGEKRNRLMDMATGEFIVFVDDDDDVSQDYIPLIVAQIGDDIDCIGIQGTMTTNGGDERQWYISIDHGSWFEKDKIYYRCPNHLAPVRREIAQKVRFRDISWREDYFYSIEILPFLKRERKIEKNIYHYKFIQK